MATKLAVYTIIDNDNGGKGFWQRLGTAYENKDGSYNIYLNANPINGKLHMREETERKQQQGDDDLPF